MEIFGFKQKKLCNAGLEVFHALILRCLIDIKTKSMDYIHDHLPILGGDTRLILQVCDDLIEGEFIEMEMDDDLINFSLKILPRAKGLQEDSERAQKFDEFFKLYGNPAGKAKAKQKFMSLPEKDIETIFKILPAYLESTCGPKEKCEEFKPMRKHAITWLNQQCYLDEYEEPKSAMESVMEAYGVKKS